jgi:hypothetical protein
MPYISKNVRLAKFFSLTIIFVGLASASQRYLPSDFRDAALILVVPAVLFFMVKLYILIFVREA